MVELKGRRQNARTWNDLDRCSESEGDEREKSEVCELHDGGIDFLGVDEKLSESVWKE